ncbi:MAG: RluA family pseudouridine synthase [Planctomycetes bacterium]|nr:RluA family pseudouridine synthase [Planctomycetota bacterium]
MPPIQFVVDRREHNKTLAFALKNRYGLSWSQAKRLVEGRHVKVSGQVEPNVTRKLQLGKRIELASGTIELKPEDRKKLADKAKRKAEKKAEGGGQKAEKAKAKTKPGVSPPSALRPPPSQRLPESTIVYQDESIVVANKPVGLTTMRHKDEAEEFGERALKFLPKTLADMLPILLGTPNRPVIAVHRIDRDTSGLVVFARTRDAAEHLTKQFRKHTVERQYLALTRGTPPAKRIDSVFVRDRGDGRRGSTTKADAPDAKRAITHVQVRESLGNFALVECRLETGRTHQVRIHLGEAGTPLCGETVYDRPINGKPLPDDSGATRPMLHAARLGFVHPDNATTLNWEAAPPEDFAKLLESIRKQ